MSATKSLKRNHQQIQKSLDLLNESRDVTAKQKHASVLQGLGINLSKSSLYRLEMN